jgi:ribonuclease HII
VLWPPETEWLPEHYEIAPQIYDSKKLSAKKRAALALAIPALAIDYGIGIVSAQEIDTNGMTWANRQAFLRALQSLTVIPDRVLIDGCLELLPEQCAALEIQEQKTIVEGDAEYLPIAAASILAKEARDAYVLKEVTQHPEWETHYGLKTNKGYGTEKHRKGIVEHGKILGHRSLFLRKLLNKKEDCMIQDDET